MISASVFLVAIRSHPSARNHIRFRAVFGGQLESAKDVVRFSDALTHVLILRTKLETSAVTDAQYSKQIASSRRVSFTRVYRVILVCHYVIAKNMNRSTVVLLIIISKTTKQFFIVAYDNKLNGSL